MEDRQIYTTAPLNALIERQIELKEKILTAKTEIAPHIGSWNPLKRLLIRLGIRQIVRAQGELEYLGELTKIELEKQGGEVPEYLKVVPKS